MKRILTICFCVGSTLLASSIWTPLSAAETDPLQAVRDLATEANQLFAKGKYKEAIESATKALSISESAFGPNDVKTGGFLDMLGTINRDAGNYQEAESLYKRGLAIREQALSADDPAVANSLMNLANLYRFTGAYHKGEPLLQRALQIDLKTLGPENRSTGTMFLNLGNWYSETGAYEQAESMYLQSLKIYEKASGEESADTARALNNLGNLYMDTGSYARSEPLHLRALAIKKKNLGLEHPDTARSFFNLGELYRYTNRYDESEKAYKQSLEIREKLLGSTHTDTSYTLSRVAEIYRLRGDLGRAQPVFEQALAALEKSVGQEHPYTSDTGIGLAKVYQTQGLFSQAAALYQRAFDVNKSIFGTDNPQTSGAASNLAVLRWAQGDTAKALELLQLAQSGQSKSSERFMLSGSEARKRAYQQALANDTFKQVSFSLESNTKQGIDLGLNSVFLYKGRVLDAMSNSMARLRLSVRHEDQALFEQLAQVASEVSILTYQGAGNSTEDYRKRVADLMMQQEKLEGELAKRSSDFRQQTTTATVAAVSRLLPGDAALIEWFRYVPFAPKTAYTEIDTAKSRYVVYVLKHDGKSTAIDMGDAQNLDDLIRSFRVSIANVAKPDLQFAATLFERTFKPLLPYLSGTTHLLISPDGLVNLLPVAALLDDKSEYLGRQFEITYLTSGRDLLRVASKGTASGNSVLIANPNFGALAELSSRTGIQRQAERSADLDRSGLIFRPLANTVLEAESLKQLLHVNSSAVLLDDAATETNVKHLHGPRILHIASHGFFLSDQELLAEIRKRNSLDQQLMPAGENPLVRSGIALSGANLRHSGTSDDGILTALEAAQLDLRGTELVVLSACDSGVGDVQNGEGVYGLRRALVLAGAQTQVTSLWKVSDEATRILMIDFYKRLLAGEGRSAALRHAQLDMLAKPEFSHPYYWASFIPIGNWKPLSALH